MAEITRPELCIVGAGALGIALAQHARRLGAHVMLVDRGHAEPGDGPQRAVQVASLVASASRAQAMRNADALGLAGVDPKISMRAVQKRAQSLAAEQAPLDSRERLTGLGISVLRGDTRFVDAMTLAVGDVQVRPQAIVLAVGGAALLPEIPGLDEAGYFTPDSILENSRKLTHLLVIGADPEGLALAQAFARLGSDVTLVPQGAALPGFDIEAAAIVLQCLSEEGVRVIDGGKLEAIQPRSQGIGATITLPDGASEVLDISHVLVCAGTQASLDDMGLEAARLRLLRGKARQFALGALGQTSNRRIRVVGASAGIGQWHHALSHGRAVIEALVLGAPRHQPAQQPQLVQTEPGLAEIGRWPTDSKPLAAGHVILRSGLGENGKARALGQDRGLAKVLVNPKGHVLAASLVGPEAGELAAVLALAMERGIPLGQLADLSLPHPSLLAILTALGENHRGTETVSSFARRMGAVRRRLRI
mgnify:FL=1